MTTAHDGNALVRVGDAGHVWWIWWNGIPGVWAPVEIKWEEIEIETRVVRHPRYDVELEPIEHWTYEETKPERDIAGLVAYCESILWPDVDQSGNNLFAHTHPTCAPGLPSSLISRIPFRKKVLTWIKDILSFRS